MLTLRVIVVDLLKPRNNTSSSTSVLMRPKNGSVPFVKRCSQQKNIWGNTRDSTQVLICINEPFILMRSKHSIKRRNSLHVRPVWQDVYVSAVVSQAFALSQVNKSSLIACFLFYAPCSRFSDERPHACEHCHRRFKELSTLHNHQRIHTGDYI